VIDICGRARSILLNESKRENMCVIPTLKISSSYFELIPTHLVILIFTDQIYLKLYFQFVNLTKKGEVVSVSG